MIDWIKTKEIYGNVDLSKYRPKVIICCDKCHRSSEFTIRVKSRLKNDQIDWLCPKCINNKKDVRIKHSESMKEKWQDKEYKRKRII